MKTHEIIIRIFVISIIIVSTLGLIQYILPIFSFFQFKYFLINVISYSIGTVKALAALSIVLGLYFYFKQKSEDYSKDIENCKERYHRLVGDLNSYNIESHHLFDYVVLANDQLFLMQKRNFPEDLKKEWINDLFVYLPFILKDKIGEEKNMNPHLFSKRIYEENVLLNYPRIKYLLSFDQKDKGVLSESFIRKSFDRTKLENESKRNKLITFLLKELNEKSSK